MMRVDIMMTKWSQEANESERARERNQSTCGFNSGTRVASVSRVVGHQVALDCPNRSELSSSESGVCYAELRGVEDK